MASAVPAATLPMASIDLSREEDDLSYCGWKIVWSIEQEVYRVMVIRTIYDMHILLQMHDKEALERFAKVEALYTIMTDRKLGCESWVV